MVPRRIRKPKHDMFGRPISIASPDQVTVSPKGERANRVLGRVRGFSGNQANFDLAGAPGKFQSAIAVFWAQWWRPWALVGILIVGLSIALLVKVL